MRGSGCCSTKLARLSELHVKVPELTCRALGRVDAVPLIRIAVPYAGVRDPDFSFQNIILTL
jgi:hypothetical protein